MPVFDFYMLNLISREKRRLDNQMAELDDSEKTTTKDVQKKKRRIIYSSSEEEEEETRNKKKKKKAKIGKRNARESSESAEEGLIRSRRVRSSSRGKGRSDSGSDEEESSEEMILEIPNKLVATIVKQTLKELSKGTIPALAEISIPKPHSPPIIETNDDLQANANILSCSDDFTVNGLPETSEAASPPPTVSSPAPTVLSTDFVYPPEAEEVTWTGGEITKLPWVSHRTKPGQNILHEVINASIFTRLFTDAVSLGRGLRSYDGSGKQAV